MATNRASRESCKSVSIKVAPNDTAFLNAAKVFSGAWPEAPRCPMMNTPVLSFSQNVAARRPTVANSRCYGSMSMLTPAYSKIGAHPELCIVSLTSRSVDSFGVADDGYSAVASIHIISQSCRGISHRL